MMTWDGEWWWINKKYIPSFSKKIQKDLGIDIFDGKWRPDEKYFLINGIDFFYCVQTAEDIMIANTDTVYWTFISQDAVLVYWYLLPVSRVIEVANSYIISKEAKHKFNMPLLAIEYLNAELNHCKLTGDNFEMLKKVITDSIDDDSWSGQYSLETFDYKFCSICGKDISWRYAKCNLCLIETEINALCLKCASIHNCKEIQYQEKYTSVELDKFYQRLDKKEEKNEAQSTLNKVQIRYPEIGCGEIVKFEIEYLNNNQSLKAYEYTTKEDTLINTSKIIPSENSFHTINIEECYKRKGKKKQKIREAMLNPLNGPRFNYEYEEEKQQNEVNDISMLNLPIPTAVKKNPLSSLVKSPRDTSLSALVSMSRKKELSENKKVNENNKIIT